MRDRLLAHRRPGSEPGLHKAVRSGLHSAHYSGVICRIWHGWTKPEDVVRGFAGDDYEQPAISERAAMLLSRYDDRALHYDA